MRAYRRWLQRLDAPAIFAVSSPRAWAVLFPTWLAIIAAEAWLPPIAGVFQLRAVPVLRLLPLLALGVALLEFLRRREGHSLRTWSALVAGCALMQATVATMAAASAGHGRFINALLYFLVVLSHSWSFRVTLKAPFMAVGAGFAALAPLLLDGSPENLSLLGGMAVGGVTLSLTVGTASEVQAVHTARVVASREALSAQLLKQSQLELVGWESRFAGLLGVHHDIRNLLSTATVRAQVASRTLATNDEALSRDELVRTFAVINDALGGVNQLVREALSAPRVDAAGTSPVPLDGCVRRAVEHANALGLPGQVSLSSPCPAATGRVPGGETSIRRILDNLLRNALEGDGLRQATHVAVSATIDGRFLHVLIDDDGPGFTEDLLRSGPRLFQTTKPVGNGLGLITTEALVTAVGGALQRNNRPGNGARVELHLPLADTLADTPAAAQPGGA